MKVLHLQGADVLDVLAREAEHLRSRCGGLDIPWLVKWSVDDFCQLNPAGLTIASQADRIRELESENARLREAFRQACDVAEEFYGFFESDRMNSSDPEDEGISTMRRNRKELLG